MKLEDGVIEQRRTIFGAGRKTRFRSSLTSRVAMKACRRSLLSVALGSSLFFSVVSEALSFDEALERIRSSGVINLGYRNGAIPFSYTYADLKDPTGYAIDVCAKIVDDVRKRLQVPHLKVRYVPVDATTRFAALTNNDIDMECANTTVTAERRNRGFSFSVPYFITGTKIMIRSGLSAKGMRDLAGKRVAVAEGTSTEKLLGTERNVNSASRNSLSIVYFKKRVDAFALLEAGEIDALVEDVTVLQSLKNSSATPGNYQIVGDYLAIEPFAVMLLAKNVDLKSVADKSIVDQMNSGLLARAHSQWFESPIPPDRRVLSIPLGHLMRDMIRYPTDKMNAFP